MNWVREHWPFDARYTAGLFLSAVGGALVGACAFKGSARGALLGMAFGTAGNILLLSSVPFPKGSV